MKAFSLKSPLSSLSSTTDFFLLLYWACSRVGEGVMCGGRTQPGVRSGAACSRGVVHGICSFLRA